MWGGGGVGGGLGGGWIKREGGGGGGGGGEGVLDRGAPSTGLRTRVCLPTVGLDQSQTADPNIIKIIVSVYRRDMFGLRCIHHSTALGALLQHPHW